MLITSQYPDNFKVIVTINRGTAKYKALKRKGAYIIKTYKMNSADIANEMLNNNPAIPTNLASSINATPYLLNALYSILKNTTNHALPMAKDLEYEEFRSIDDIIIYCLSFCEKKFYKPGSFKKLLGFLAYSEIGFTAPDLSILCECNDDPINLFIEMFDFALIKAKIYLKKAGKDKFQQHIHYSVADINIKNIFRQYAVFSKYDSYKLLDIFAAACKKSRMMDEMNIISKWEYINYLYKAKSWTYLKDMISDIKMFGYLFKPECQIKLFICWNKMISYGYDPVTEYNNELENFLRGYFYSFKELFYILLLLSRFFYDLKDAESDATPEFRHPPFKSSRSCVKELISIHLFRLLNFDLLNKDMIGNIAKKKPQIEEHEEHNIDESPKKKEEQPKEENNSESKDKPKKEGKKKEKDKESGTVNINKFLEPIKGKMEINNILKEEECIDLRNPNNKEKIYNILSERIQKNKNVLKIETTMAKSLYFLKRWIWIQFGWLCADNSQNFSKFFLHIIEYPYGTLNYITYSSELQLYKVTMQIIKIIANSLKKEKQDDKIDSDLSMNNKDLFKDNESINFETLNDSIKEEANENKIVESFQADSSIVKPKSARQRNYRRIITSNHEQFISMNKTPRQVLSAKHRVIKNVPEYRFSPVIINEAEKLQKFDQLIGIASAYEDGAKIYLQQLERKRLEAIEEHDMVLIRMYAH